MKVVIALGGNAILKKGDKPTIKAQIENTRRVLKKLFPLIKNNKAVITHGNGPQAGYLLLQQEKGIGMPLDVLDAETEGQIGYLIQQILYNLLQKNKVKKNVVTVLTQVLVDKNDTAFSKPSKFVGPFYTKPQAGKLKNKFRIKEDIGRGYRRVVASPRPLEIIESGVINNILNYSFVIAVGGGGIPVVKERNELKGIDAVVDKDLASQCLADSINADILVMITDIDRVYLNYKQKNQKGLDKASLKEIRKYYLEGHFPPGSMGPKIEAAINFLENGGKKVIITNVENINGKGTVIVR
ncbi:hypothetical protein AUJ84_03575 [Candidatus Pacearchaeota archaeon CG1_02_32_132]|nr:MAG: hypothetical protein AUJ84_03575 [Candidatus Pacearchaeota archaeon CG1_02_32_132]